MLDRLVTYNPQAATLWPAEIALLALAVEGKVIGALSHERIMAANAANFVDTIVKRPVLH